MRTRKTFLLTSAALIVILLFREAMQSTKWYGSVFKNENEFQNNEIWQNLIYAAEKIRNKFLSEEKVVNMTLYSFFITSESVLSESDNLLISVNNSIRELQQGLFSQTTEVHERLQKILQKLQAFSSIESFYTDVNKQIEYIHIYCQRRLQNSEEKIQNHIQELQYLENDLIMIRNEVKNIRKILGEDMIVTWIEEVNTQLKQIKQKTNNEVQNIINQARQKLHKINGVEVDGNKQFINIVNDSEKQLNETFFAIEKKMLRIDLQNSMTFRQKENNVRRTVELSTKKLNRINNNISQIVQSIDFLIDEEEKLMDVDMDQIKRLSHTRIKIHTEAGENFLNTEEHVPYCGLSPGEILLSFNHNGTRISINTMGINNSDGTHFLRELQKDEINSTTEYVTETFYNDKEQVQSKKKYIFIYVDSNEK